MFKRFLMAVAIAILLAPIVAGCSFSAGNIGCLYSEPRLAELPLDGVTSVRIEARTGNLTVQGNPGATELVVQGTACSSRESELAEIQVRAERQGSEAVLTVVMPSLSSWGSRQVDLVVAIPETLPVRVTASAGNFEAGRLASLDLEKGAGNVLIDGIAGDLVARTSAGTMRVNNVQGSTTIRASAGNLYIDGMGGTVTIPTKSSGTVTINGVKGDLVLGDIRRERAGHSGCPPDRGRPDREGPGAGQRHLWRDRREGGGPLPVELQVDNAQTCYTTG